MTIRLTKNVCSKFRFVVRVIYGSTVFINRSFKRLFVSPIYCKITAVALNRVDEVFSVTGQIRFYVSLVEKKVYM